MFFCREFIRDLIEHGDANFAKRVLAKAVSSQGDFVPDADDHKYNGIADVWIRYVSRQGTAYRALFVRKGEDVYWYRAGGHSVEDNLKAPSALGEAIALEATPGGLDALAQARNPRYSHSTKARYLREVLGARILVAHRSVTLVSPKIDPAVAHPTAVVGRLINSVIENGGTVTVLTSPPTRKTLGDYRWLAARGVELLIHGHLNARLYYFEVDEDRRPAELSHYNTMALVGSAELTGAGLNLANAAETSEELCYEILADDTDGSYEFLLGLSDSAIDLETYVRTEQLA